MRQKCRRCWGWACGHFLYIVAISLLIDRFTLLFRLMSKSVHERPKVGWILQAPNPNELEDPCNAKPYINIHKPWKRDSDDFPIEFPEIGRCGILTAHQRRTEAGKQPERFPAHRLPLHGGHHVNVGRMQLAKSPLPF